MGDVTVVVATFGDDAWAALARERAVPSAERQAPVIHVHGETLAESRNRGLARVETDHVIHLDADDELTPGYVETLAAGAADLRAPAVQYVRNGRPRPPYVPRVAGHEHACDAGCLEYGNWLVIGTWAPAQVLRDVGGWRNEPVYEDWSLFLRAYRAGASVAAIPAAVYRAHWRADSRNRAQPMEVKNDWHRRIADAA